MKIHPDYLEHEIFAKAASSIEEGDYLQALEYYDEMMRLMSGQNKSEEFNFYSGPYLELIYKTGNYANMLAGCGYYLQAYELAGALLSRLENSGDDSIINWLKNLENESLRNALFSRNSSKINDAIICCADDSIDKVQRPLLTALHKLGVSVQPSPYTIPINRSDFDFKDIPVISDALIVILSPGFFASNWPKEELYEIINKTGNHSIQVIPIWYSISRPQVLAASESLEKVLAFDAISKDISEIAQGIADIVRPDLASGALHKTIWASLLQRKIISDAFTDFSLPVRHITLDKDLMDRIRLIRAAFLEGNRQMMKSWVHAFSCELEPYTAVAEWERLACVFQEIRITQRRINLLEHQGFGDQSGNNWIVDVVTKNINLFADLISVNIQEEEAIYDLVMNYFLELVSYPSDRIFVLVWIVSQPVLMEMGVSFEREILKMTDIIFFKTLKPLFEPDDDWVKDVSVAKNNDKAFDPIIKTWDAVAEGIIGKDNLVEGILHTDEERPWSKEWDVFISHASEDKAEFVRPLAEALKDYGVKVWYDTFTLKPGKSLGDSIFTGIDAAEFGIIVLSPSFIKKEWPRKEYEFLRKNQTEQGDRLITYWYKLTPEERPEWIKDFDFDTSLNSTNQAITALTMKVLEKIRPDLARFIQKKLNYQKVIDEKNKDNVQMNEVHLSDLNFVGEPRYERLEQGLVDRIRLIRSVIFEGNPHSLKFWIDGFLRDYDPERQVEHWQGIASMYKEAIMWVDFLQDSEKKSLPDSQGPEQSKIEHAEIYRMIYLLNNYPDEILPEMQEKYTEKIVNSLIAIVSSPTVIDLLDPD